LLVDFGASLQTIRYLNLVSRQTFGAASPDFAGRAGFLRVNYKGVFQVSVFVILPFSIDFRLSNKFAIVTDNSTGIHLLDGCRGIFDLPFFRLPCSSRVFEFSLFHIPHLDSRVLRLVAHPDINCVCICKV